jgi:uncharacterized protein (DUF362 family)
LLKPNVVTVPRWLPLGGTPRAAVTDARFVEALLRVFAGYEVTIAEGAAASRRTAEVLERTGIAAVARRHGARVVALDRAARFEVDWAYGTLRLPRLLETHEYINVPKLKTHVQTGVTLATKNQKGLLTSGDKVRFHRELTLHAAIRALAETVEPALSIVDGIVGLEGPGPALGRPRRAGAIVAGRDMDAVDVVWCDLMSVGLERVAHVDRVAYETVGRSVETMRVRFAAPTTIRVANVVIHAPPSGCSRCLLSLQEGAATVWRSPRHVLRGLWHCVLQRTDVVVGAAEGVPAAARGRVVCYGNCTQALAEREGVAVRAGLSAGGGGVFAVVLGAGESRAEAEVES